ncbi:MAG: hypothetical protein HY268_19950 [Deltaproteobacteria bacterium]|nr:hypothetical protein [Deltaproteobacteria bacterium]
MTPKVSPTLIESAEVRQQKGKVSDRDLFDLFIKFTEQMVRITGQSLSRCLLDYTPFYRRLGLGVDWDENNPQWQDFVRALEHSATPADTAVLCYNNREIGKGNQETGTGCFSYEYEEKEKTIHLHFANADKSGKSPLSEERVPTRIEELNRMFTEIKRLHPEAVKVRGSGWLLNVHSYCRLWPSQYAASARISRNGLNGMGVWGQFIDKDRAFKQDMAQTFLDKVRVARNTEEAVDAFHYKRKNSECDIEYFYSYYGIT